MLRMQLNRRRAALGVSAVLAIVTAGMMTVGASAASTARVTGVAWHGTSANPTVTITGTGFGTKAPKGTAANLAPGCSIGGNAGLDRGNNLWFIENTVNWIGGQGKPPNSRCLRRRDRLELEQHLDHPELRQLVRPERMDRP